MRKITLFFTFFLFIICVNADQLDNYTEKPIANYGNYMILIKTDDGTLHSGLYLDRGILITNYRIEDTDNVMSLTGKAVMIEEENFIKYEEGLYFYKTTTAFGKIKFIDNIDTRNEKWYVFVEILNNGSVNGSIRKLALKAIRKRVSVKGFKFVFNNNGSLVGVYYNYDIGSLIKYIFHRIKAGDNIEIDAIFGGKFNTIPELMNIAKTDLKRPAWLGITFSIRKNKVLINGVFKDSPADKYGLKEGDLILEADGKPILTITELTSVMREKKEGDRIRLTIKRGNNILKKKIVLAGKKRIIYRSHQNNNMENIKKELKKLEEKLDDLKERLKNH